MGYNSPMEVPPRYTFLDHTGDAEFQAFGVTLEEAMANAALAVAALMWDWKSVDQTRSRQVRVEGRDLAQLLVGFLEEVLYLFDSEGFLLGAVEDLRLRQEGGRQRLEAVFRGDGLSARYPLHGAVKAVTYNDLKVERGEGRVMLQVVVDV